MSGVMSRSPVLLCHDAENCMRVTWAFQGKPFACVTSETSHGQELCF